MTASEFIESAIMRGIAFAGEIRKWVESNPKDDYTEDDMIAAYQDAPSNRIDTSGLIHPSRNIGTFLIVEIISDMYFKGRHSKSGKALFTQLKSTAKHYYTLLDAINDCETLPGTVVVDHLNNVVAGQAES